MNQVKWTVEDFPQMSWHDCHVHSVAWDQDGEWQSDLVMDIDYITEWLCGTDKSCRFMVAPATLRFHNVDNLRVDLTLKFKQPIEIDSVERSRLPDERFTNYHWTIAIQNSSGEKDNTILFDATDFTQELTGRPMEIEGQCLTASARANLKREFVEQRQ